MNTSSKERNLYSRTADAGYILEGLPDTIEKIKEGTAILWSEIQPSSLQEPVKIAVEFTEQADLIVEKAGTLIRISCHQPAHYFRGLNWALHHLKEDQAEKREYAYFPQHGFMLDCSRNSVFTVKKVKSFIRLLASLGMSELMLYTEDTYEVPEEPYFGTYRGRFSKEEIREMDAYARIFGIELVPCIQTLAHLRCALRWPMGADLKDTTDIVLVGEEKVYTFLEELLRSIKEAFSTRRIHLGMDEALELGLGNYLRKNGFKDRSLVIQEHCSRVLAICKKLELEPMMWSDMYISANTGEGYYELHSMEDTSDWVKPEEGLGLVYWDYYHDDEAIYQNQLRVHKELTGKVTFAGGTWIWNGISPNYSRAFACTRPALKACREQNIREVFCTGWMDNGAETPVDAVYPGLVLFAHLGFHKELDEALFAEEFQDTVGGRLEDFLQLDTFDSLFVGTEPNITADNPSKFLLYQDTLLGMFDYHVRGIDTASYYGDLAVRLADCAKTSPAYQELFTFYQLLAEVLSQKADLGIRIKSAYDRHDRSALEQICQETFPHLTETMKKLKLLREELWLRDAKPFGYELLDIKLGGVITRLESNRRRLLSYLNGQAERLEELEQPRLPYFATEQSLHHGRDVELSENKWDKIISGCMLVDTI